MHFVKHSLILAMLAVLTGCGGGSSNAPAPSGGSPANTVEDRLVVSSITPQTATVGVETTFALTGQKINSNIQASITNCQNISSISGSTTRVTFTCTPQVAGAQTVTVKDAAGQTLFTGQINVQTLANTAAVVISDIVVPSKIVVGELASFTVTGRNLNNTLQIGMTQCINPTQTSVTTTQIVFTCLPQAAGSQTFVVANAETQLQSRAVNVQIQPPKLTGAWRQSAAAGCLGTLDGEAIVGVRSKKPLFTFVTDSATRVRLMGNEGISYTTADCSESSTATATPAVPVFAFTTAIATPAAIYDTGTVQQTADGTFYYAVTTRYSNNSAATPPATAIVFKNADTFCLFNGVVSAANISQYIQNVDLSQSGCFVRNTRLPFSQQAPSTVRTTYVYDVPQRPDNENLLSAQLRFNQLGATGYSLQGDAKTLKTTLTGSTSAEYDILTKIEAFSDYRFEYLTRDEPTADTNFDTNRLAQLNQLGAQGQLFLGAKSLSALSTPKTLYAKASTATGITQAFSYQLRTDSDLTATKLISNLNTFGAQGCRFVDLRLQFNLTNTHATTCVNSSRHNGTFAYKIIDYPTSERADALKTLLDTQKSSGFYPIRVVSIGTNAVTQLLFEYDSVSASGIQAMEYKVYSQTLTLSQPELVDFLNDQGKLGWSLWSPLNRVNNTPLATIFASLPFPHVLDGESLSLAHR